MTEWWIGSIAGQTTRKTISQFQAPTSDWFLILRYTPSSPTVWLRHIAHRTHRIGEGRGVVVSRPLVVVSASRRSDLPSQAISGASRGFPDHWKRKEFCPKSALVGERRSSYD